MTTRELIHARYAMLVDVEAKLQTLCTPEVYAAWKVIKKAIIPPANSTATGDEYRKHLDMMDYLILSLEITRTGYLNTPRDVGE